MSILYINTGSAPNAGDGDTLRTAFNKINQNFLQLYYGGEVVQSDQPPAVITSSTLWYDTISGRTYVYYNGSWVDASPANEGANTTFLTSASIAQYTGYLQAVSLYDSLTGTYTNTVTNITHLNFDTEGAFSVTDQGSGAVLIGMNSTFKYINVDGQPGLTAVGIDNLHLIAGDGIGIVTDPTPGTQSIRINVLNPVPSSTSSGLLFNDGADNLSWITPHFDQLVNGTSTFSLTTSGSVLFNDGTEQNTAYVPPVSNGDNSTKPIVFVDVDNALQSYYTVGMNPQMGQITLNSIIVGSNILTGPVIGSLQLVHTGTSYIVSGISQATSGGTGAGLTVSFTALQGTLTSAVIANPGTGYSVGDIVSVVNTLTNNTATFRITAVNSPGLQGYLQLPDGTKQTTAYTGTVNYNNIVGLTNTNISTFINDVGYITSNNFTTTNVGVFINNVGYLTSATVNQYVATTNTAGNFILNGGLIIKNTSTATMILTGTVNGGLIASALNAKPLTVTTYNGPTTYTWQFNSDGSVTWPDGSVQNSASSATIAAGTLTNKIYFGTATLSVLANGTVKYPDGTIQLTAYTGTTFTGVATTATDASRLINADGVTALRIVPPPATLVGQLGDLAGDIAYDGTYLYVATQDYVQTNYNATAATTQNNVYFIEILQAGVPVPQVGWEVHDPIGGPLMTITQVTSALAGPTNIPIWRLTETTYANSYYPGLSYILVNPAGTTAIWGRARLSTAANTATSVTKLSNFVTLDTPVSLGNVCAFWHGPGNTLKIGGVNTAFTGTYNLQAYYNNVPVGSQGAGVTFSTTGTVVGGTSLTPGDRADVILTIPSTRTAYRIIGITGSTFNDNFISIEQIA